MFPGNVVGAAYNFSFVVCIQRKPSLKLDHKAVRDKSQEGGNYSNDA